MVNESDWDRIIKPLLEKTPSELTEWFKANGLIRRYFICPVCNQECLWRSRKDVPSALNWVCLCGARFSARRDSFFEKSKLSFSIWIQILFSWSIGEQLKFLYSRLGVSSVTAIKCYQSLRRLCGICLENDPILLGGVGHYVELDESYFGFKRKYNKGRGNAKGVWVFGIVDSEFSRDKRKLFATVVEDRSANTLIPLIQANVIPGSTIHSDMWSAYNSLNSLGFNHRVVNHSENFVNPETGCIHKPSKAYGQV